MKNKHMAVKIIIDSALDITKEEAKHLGLWFIPIEVRFRKDKYFDGFAYFIK